MSELDDIKRRAGITEQGDPLAELNALKSEAYKVISDYNQRLRQYENVRGIKEAREHFSEGLDILSRGGAWR